MSVFQSISTGTLQNTFKDPLGSLTRKTTTTTPLKGLIRPAATLKFGGSLGGAGQRPHRPLPRAGPHVTHSMCGGGRRTIQSKGFLMYYNGHKRSRVICFYSFTTTAEHPQMIHLKDFMWLGVPMCLYYTLMKIMYLYN